MYTTGKTPSCGALNDGAPHSADTSNEERPPVSPDVQDRLYAKYDAARMIVLLRQRFGLSEAQFAARLGMKLKDVLAVEIGEADYQHTMDMRDRVQTVLGHDAGDSAMQPQAERRAATVVAEWIKNLPD